MPGSEARARGLEQLAGGTVDLLVIGGGIIGSRVACEAARSGLSVALIDAGDFGNATSAASSKLIHGGLRYLATGDLRLVRELQAERDALATRVAPHLVHSLPLVLAVERSFAHRVPKLVTALAVYTAVSGFRRPRPRLLRSESASRLVPLEPGSISACGVVDEALTHDARLTLATARGAARAGAISLNYVRAASIERAGKDTVAVALEDALGGERLTTRCRAVVNAAGPWVDHVRRLENPDAEPLARLSKGVHAVLPLDGDWHAGVALFDDSRSAVAIPWHGLLLIGATDVPYEGEPAEVAPAPDEVATLLEWFSGVLPAEQLRANRVVSAFAGLRVLPPGLKETARASRRHSTVVGPLGVVSIAGGKLTSHRTIALDALRHLPAELRPRLARPSDGGLPGAEVEGAASALKRRVDPETARHLLSLYGGEALRVLAYAESVPNALERIHPDGPDVWAQAHFAVESEWAMTVEDVASRRTTLAVRGLAGDEVRAGLARLVRQPVEAPAPLLTPR